MILKPKIYGLCRGAKNALDIALAQDENTIVFKEILHNKEVIKKLEKKGIKTLDYIPIDKKIIIRAHGETRDTYKYLEKNNIDYIDATCKNVQRVQKLIEEYHNKGFKIIIIGKKNHPEVIGENGWCDNKAIIIESENDIIEVSDKTLIICQTTVSQEKALKIVNKLKNEHTIFINTICNAQRKIQEEAKKLAQEVDLMIVVGDKNSSNSCELFRICNNETKSLMINSVEEAVRLNIDKSQKIGITGGASTPNYLIDEIIKVIE